MAKSGKARHRIRIDKLELHLATHNLDLQQFAEKSGVSYSTVRRARAGENLNPSVVRDLAKAMGITTEDLVDDSDDSPREKLEWRKPFEQYLRDVRKFYGTIETLGMAVTEDNSRALDLDRLYVVPQLANMETKAEYFDRSEKDRRENAAGRVVSDLTPEYLVGLGQRVVLLAPAGFGKTVFMRWLTIQLADPRRNPWREAFDDAIPLLLTLRDLQLDESVDTWEKLLAQLRLIEPKDFFYAELDALQKAFEAGRVVVLLDGLDEIALSIRRSLHKAIWEGLAKYRKTTTRWLATSRIQGYDEMPIGVSPMELKLRSLPGGTFTSPIIGARRTGKTTFLNALFSEKPQSNDDSIDHLSLEGRGRAALRSGEGDEDLQSEEPSSQGQTHHPHPPRNAATSPLKGEVDHGASLASHAEILPHNDDPIDHLPLQGGGRSALRTGEGEWDFILENTATNSKSLRKAVAALIEEEPDTIRHCISETVKEVEPKVATSVALSFHNRGACEFTTTFVGNLIIGRRAEGEPRPYHIINGNKLVAFDHDETHLSRKHCEIIPVMDAEGKVTGICIQNHSASQTIRLLNGVSVYPKTSSIVLDLPQSVWFPMWHSEHILDRIATIELPLNSRPASNLHQSARATSLAEETTKESLVEPESKTLTSLSTSRRLDTVFRTEQFSEDSVAERWAIHLFVPFDDDRIQRYSQHWYAQRSQTAKLAVDDATDFWNAIQQADDTRRLARIPSLLTLMALVHQNIARLPKGRVELYEKITLAYTDTIDSKRKLKGRFTSNQARRWLAQVAFQMQKRRDAKAGRRDVTATYSEIMSCLHDAMEPEQFPNLEQAKTEFLDQIVKRSGLLAETQQQGTYAFLHLSFLEYFAAIDAIRQMKHGIAKGNQELLGLFRTWTTERHWAEMFLFVFQILKQTEDWEQHESIRQALFGDDNQLGQKFTEREKNQQLLLLELAADTFSGFDRAVRTRDGVRTVQRILWDGITKLNFAYSTITDLEPLANLSQLQSLNLDGTQVTVAGLRHLAPLPLQRLDLRGTQVTDAGLLHLAPLPLQTLYLGYTQVTDAGLRHLAQLPLQTLDLTATKVTDAGLRHLAQLPLQTLDLSRTTVTDAGLRHLAQLPLQRLDLSGTQVTDAGVAKLRSQIPGITISH